MNAATHVHYELLRSFRNRLTWALVLGASTRRLLRGRFGPTAMHSSTPLASPFLSTS